MSLELYNQSNERAEHKNQLVQKVQSLGLKQDEYMVISSAAMELLGCDRVSGDIDILVTEDVYDALVTSSREKGLEEVESSGLKMLNGNGFNIFYDLVVGVGTEKEVRYLDYYQPVKSSEGVMCMSLSDVMEYKERRGKEKDINDVRLINEELNES